MVVAKFHRQRWLRRICIGVLCILLLNEAGDYGIRTDDTLLQLHRPYGPNVLAANRDHWLFRCVLLHPQDLRSRQN